MGGQNTQVATLTQSHAVLRGLLTCEWSQAVAGLWGHSRPCPQGAHRWGRRLRPGIGHKIQEPRLVGATNVVWSQERNDRELDVGAGS